MRSALVVTGIAMAIFMSTSASAEQTSPVQPMALSCGSTQTQLLPNGAGVLMTRTCNGLTISGVGSSTQAASENLTKFTSLAATGPSCSFNSQNGFALPGGLGGYFTCFEPTQSSTVGAMGTTMTDLGNEIYESAVIYEQTGARCIVSPPGSQHVKTVIPGGFIITYHCYGVGEASSAAYIHGAGSTFTDAAQVLRRQITFAAANKRQCSFESIQRVGLGFEADLYCANPVYGYTIHKGTGSTVTQAANDAAIQAGI